MDIAGSTHSLYSYANPVAARVIDIHLKLNVDFFRKVLEGSAILTIERNPRVECVILDIWELDIKSVKNFYSKSCLNYNFEKLQSFGNIFVIQLPIEADDKSICKIEIKYATSPNSPALHWLTSEQTANGFYPFLLSNNELIYARAMFPCQDTPSVKFTYSAQILVPKYFSVLMSAHLQDKTEDREHVVYKFLQMKPIPSYAVTIAVGLLQEKQISTKCNVYAENKFINEGLNTFLSGTIESMLQTAESLCGPYMWDRYDVCVLPPSIAHFNIQCPCVIFISPTILRGDRSGIIFLLASKISQSWAGNLVTCASYDHLWLNKSFNTFICRRLIRKMINEEIWYYIESITAHEQRIMIQKYRNAHLLKSLLFSLSGPRPHESIRYVPYEIGYILLCHLEEVLGGPSVFEPFFRYYFHEFAFKSISTKNWKDYLYRYFHCQKEVLDTIKWHTWFSDTNFSPIMLQTTARKRMFYNIAKVWAYWNEEAHDLPIILTYRSDLSDVEKYILLNDLNSFHMGLTEKKMKLISDLYMFDIQSGIIRFAWLLLCIKVRWLKKIKAAWDFAIQFCSPNYACPIFRHLYEWTEVRPLAIEIYKMHKEKMLAETQEKLDIILHLN